MCSRFIAAVFNIFPKEDRNKAEAAGSAYVFVKGADDSWSQQTKFTAKDGAENDWFDRSVSLSASADGGAALIGAGNDDKGSNSGFAYLFSSTPVTTSVPISKMRLRR